MRTNISNEIKVKEDIENVLRQMCFGRSGEWSEGMVDRIFETNVIDDKCIMDDIVVDEDIIVTALMEIVEKDYEWLHMNKKKAVICSTLLSVILFAVFVATLLIKSHYGFTLFDVIAPCIVGAYMGEKIKKFYNWLIKE